MLRLRKFLPMLVVALGATIVLGAPSAAEAALYLRISTDAGATFTDFVGAENDQLVTGSVTFGTATIDVRARTNQPVGAGFGQISQVQLNFTNTGATVTGIGLVVRISDTDFVAPSGPAILSSSFSGTVGPGTTGVTTGGFVSTFQSALDNDNVLFGGLPVTATAPTGATGANTDTTGLQAVVIPLIFSGTQDFGGSTFKGTTADAPYSLSNEFRITSLTLGGGSDFELTGITNLSAVPAPAALILAFVGIPALGVGGWLRRRGQAVQQ